MPSSSTTKIRLLDMAGLFLLELGFVEREPEFDTAPILHAEPALHLISENVNETQTQRRAGRPIEVRRQADPIVFDQQFEGVVRRAGEGHLEDSAPIVRERMLKAVGNEFVEDQPKGDGRVKVE